MAKSKRNSSDGTKPKKDKAEIMPRGKTSEERAAIERDRRDNRMLNREIAEEMKEKQDEMTNPESGTFDIMFQKQEECSKGAKHTREAVLEAQNYAKTTEMANVMTKKICSSVAQLDCTKFITKLRNGLDTREWSQLGHQVSHFFRTAPRIEFMNGPIDVEAKVRKQAGKRVRETGTAEKAPEMISDNVANDSKFKVRATVMEKLLKKHEKHMKRQKVDTGKSDAPMEMLPFVVNPRSFSQTVENIFDLSFRVKDSITSIEVGDNGQPFLRETSGSTQGAVSRQCVIGFSMKDFHEIVEAYGLEGKEPIIPHREREFGGEDE